MSSLKFTGLSLLIAVVLVSLGYFLIKSYGSAKFDAGKSEGISLCNVANVEQGNKARQKLERNIDETKKIPDSGLDAELAFIGILRPLNDR